MTDQGNLSKRSPSEKRFALEELFDTPCDNQAIMKAALLFADSDRGVRESAARLLVLCSNESAANIVAPYIESKNISIRNLAGDTLVRMGFNAVKPVLKYLNSPNKDVRKFAIDILAQLPASSEADKIAHHLVDEDKNVICAAIDALGSLQANSYAKELIQLYSRYEFARPNIVHALSKFGNNVPVDFFLNSLSDRDPVVQLASAEALSFRGGSSILNLLIEKMEAVSPLAKPVLVHSIIKVMENSYSDRSLPPSLKPHLIEMLDDPDPLYIRAAIRGLKYSFDDNTLKNVIRHYGQKSDSIDIAIVDALKEYTKSANVIIHELKQGNVKPVQAIPLILNLLGENNLQVTNDVPGFFNDLCSIIENNYTDIETETRVAAVEFCSRILSEDSAKVIRLALKDSEYIVRSFALDIVRDLDPRMFLDELKVLQEDYNEDIRDAATEIVEEIAKGNRN
jgi:FOG: HEAT repeat